MNIKKYVILDNNKPNIFFDMDGVMAEYNNVPYKKLYEQGYFYNLKPIENTINTIKNFIEDDKYNIYVLSSVLADSDYAAIEKRNWLHKYLPELNDDFILFTICGYDKRDFIEKNLTENDILIDDYTPNLQNWSRNIDNSKGKAIKFINGINNKKGTWKGVKISYKSDTLFRDIIKYTNHTNPIIMKAGITK